MHPFPATSELQFLVGATLEHVFIAPWRFDFIFDKVSIAVEGDLEHVDYEGVVRRHNTDADRLGPIYVHHLLEQTVATVYVESLCLTLAFIRGDLLRIYSERGMFECGQIYDDKGQLIVF